MQRPDPGGRELEQERWELLRQVSDLVEKPLIALSLVWVLLLILEFTVGLSDWLLVVTYTIWAVFILDFAVRLIIAPDRVAFVRQNWLVAVSLVLPALRVFAAFRAFRLLRAATASRSLVLARFVTSLNRSIRAVRGTFGRRRLGYLVSVTAIITFAGAAVMYQLERPSAIGETPGGGFQSYGDALWWTAMLMTTVGSESWPQTGAGRLVAFVLSVYALGVFTYITATLATHFIGQDIDRERQDR